MNKAKLISENKTEQKLKNFISTIAECCGEDYAAEIMVTDENVKQAISIFSSKLDNDKEEDIIYALLKGSIISDDREDLSNHLVSALIEDNEIPTLVEYFKTNIPFRRELARTFVKNSYRKNEDILNANKEKEYSLENLISFRNFKRSFDRQKKITLNK